jgi:hypothetical protein
MNEPLSRSAYEAMGEPGGSGSREARYPTPARIFVMVLYVAVGLWYLYWRTGTFNGDALSFSLLLYGAEVFGFVTALLHLVMTWRVTERQPPAPASGLTVDVFIPTINESVDIVRRTAIAAMNMSYPHQTWLLDDGARPEMRKLAASLGCRYLARNTNVDAKAGNLNHALAHSRAQFVAVFDADHAPRRISLSARWASSATPKSPSSRRRRTFSISIPSSTEEPRPLPSGRSSLSSSRSSSRARISGTHRSSAAVVASSAAARSTRSAASRPVA